MRVSVSSLSGLSEAERSRLVERASLLARQRIERIRHLPEYREAVARLILAGFHAEQAKAWALLEAGVRFVAACCSRRAGKTYFMASLIVLLLLKAKFNQEVVFIAPTLKRGKELIWRELTRTIDYYHLGWKCTENTGTVQTPDGAYFRIVGLDNKRQIDKISRGGNTVAALCDESQVYAHLMPQLMVGMRPALAQTRGAFLACGTPGIAEQGWWHEAAVQEKHGFRSVHWTLFENPHLGRDPEEILREEMADNGWDENHPTLLREYRGRWITDTNALVFDFMRSRNTVTIDSEGFFVANGKRADVKYDRATWRHWVGIDYGFNDPSAWVVVAAAPHARDLYVVYCEQHSGLTDDEIAETTRRIVDTFKPRGVVGDSASGGSTFMHSWNARYGSKYGVRIRPAKKHDKPGSIKTVNTELRKERLKLLLPVCEEMALDMGRLQWADAERTQILEGAAFPDHLEDALRYVVMECTAHMTKDAPKEPTAEERELALIIARNRAAEMQRAQSFGE